MKLSRNAYLAAATAWIAVLPCVLTVPALGGDHPVPAKWSVQVDKVDAGSSNISPEFRVAIYENLLDELVKTKQFSAVLRSGDRAADAVPDLLILKTTVESYTPGSETKRAVTTIGGATKIKVRSQLCTRDGQVVLEHVVDGNVRILGGNLRATHNLAHNVASIVKNSALPDPTPPIREEQVSGPSAKRS